MRTRTPGPTPLRAVRRRAGGVATAALLLLLAGCAAERTLKVTSDPPGASVWLDDDPVGLTPVELEFFHYGTRRVTLRKPGYGSFSERVELDPPWYGRFPLDLVSEVLLPVGWEDRHHVHVVLVEGEEDLSVPTLRSVLERAEVLRRADVSGPRELPPVVVAPVAPAARPDPTPPEVPTPVDGPAPDPPAPDPDEPPERP